MNRSIQTCLVTFLFLVAPICSAQRTLAVAPSIPQELRVALVIGNATYRESPLRNPANDATDVAAALRGLGFSVILLTNANRRQMVESIRDFGSRIRQGGVGLFYFAGHGVQSRGKNFLIPINGQIQNEADLEFESVDANMVLAQMDDAGNRVNIVILDACRDNPFARSFRSASRGLAQMDSAKGSFLAYATSPGSTAADGDGRNGIYTKHLLASLADPDSRLEEVFKRVRLGVAKETGNKQIPWDASSILGDFFFREKSGTSPGQTIDIAASGGSASSAPTLSATKLTDSSNPTTSTPAPPAKDAISGERSPVPTQAALPQQVALSQSSVRLGVTTSLPKPGTSFRDCDDCPEMTVIPSGRYLMGSSPTEGGLFSFEQPQHTVSLERPFAVGKFEVTFDEWAVCVSERGCRQNPGDSRMGRGSRPVINVSWDDAKQYVQWLAKKTGKPYRLLSESEWEYAARAGTSTPFNLGLNLSQAQSNFDASYPYNGSPLGNRSRGIVPVGKYPPNAFGLFDMHGNVLEWTEDCLNQDYNGAPSDGSPWLDGNCGRRITRGGSWINAAQYLRSAYRANSDTGERSAWIGFRIARD